MRAILCKEYGPAETLVIEDVTSPVVKGHGVKVRVKAAGLNFPDTLIIEGKYQLKPTMPFSPGGEMSGEVIEVGEKVTRFKPGDRVAGLTGYGAFAEEVVVPEQNILPIPESMSDEKVKEAINMLLEKYDRELVAVYLTAFNASNADRWDNLDSLLADDERLQLGA